MDAANCELFLKNYVPTMTDTPVKDAKYMEQLVSSCAPLNNQPSKS